MKVMTERPAIKAITVITTITIITFVIGLLLLSKFQTEIFKIISNWGYIGVFIVVFIVDMLPHPIGPEVAFIQGNILELKLITVTVVALCASIGASFVDYFIGKFFYSFVVKKEKTDRYTLFYHKHGHYALILAALTPVPYVPFCWLSGSFGYRLDRFIYFAIIPRMIRILFVALLFNLFW